MIVAAAVAVTVEMVAAAVARKGGNHVDGATVHYCVHAGPCHDRDRREFIGDF